MADTHGETAIDDWTLIPRQDADYGETIAYGRGLLDRAREMAAA